MDHNNRHYVGYWRNLVFFKKNHEPVGLHSPAASKNRTGFCNKSRSEGNTDELKKDINKIREDYTPKETHSKDFDGCQKEIKEIRQNYLTKDDFIREINKVDRKVEQMLNMMIEMTRNGGSQ